MNIATLAQTLFCPAQCNLAADAARLCAAVFGLVVVALEGWLRLPIRPLFDGYVQALMPRLSSIAAVIFSPRSGS